MMFIYLFLVQHNLQQEKEIKANKMMFNNLVAILLPPRSHKIHDIVCILPLKKKGW